MPTEQALAGRRLSAINVASLLFGGFFLLLYVAFLRFLPYGGHAEFAYFPPARFPFDPMHGFTFEQLALHLGRMALLGPALLGLGFGLAGWVPELRLRGEGSKRLALVATGVSLLLSAAVLTKVLRGWAIVDDELSYRQQAALLAEGRLADNTIPDWGYEAFTISTPLGFTGKYLFGEPLVQIVGTWMDLPGVMHLPLAALSLLLWFRILRREAGEEVAGWGAAFLALSPMWALTSATGTSHTSSLFCVVAAGYGVHLLRHGRPWLGAVVAGTAIGFGLTVRMQVMLPMGAILGLVAVAELLRRRRLGPLAVLCACVGFWLGLIALYNQTIAGAWWRLPWYLFQPLERFGFGPINNEAGTGMHTPWRGLQNLAVSAVRFNGWWLGLPLGLAVVVVWAALGRPGAGLRLWLWAGAALAVFNFFYYSPGISDTGPVYYFELLLPGSLLAAHTVVEAQSRWPRVAAALLAVHLLLGTGSFLGEQVARLRRLSHVAHDPVRDALALAKEPALVLYETVPQEALHAGWVFSFPVRYRSDSDPIVTFPRHRPEIVRALRARYPARNCYYYRVDPATTGPQLLECAAAEDLLARPYELPGPAMLLRSTADKIGLGLSKWSSPPAPPSSEP